MNHKQAHFVRVSAMYKQRSQCGIQLHCPISAENNSYNCQSRTTLPSSHHIPGNSIIGEPALLALLLESHIVPY
jgi:hypothetical protein